MAAGALVAMADGEVKFSEMSALDDLLENVRELQIYDPHVAVDLCRRYVEAIAADVETATPRRLKRSGGSPAMTRPRGWSYKCAW